MMIVAGVDIGSSTAKAVILSDGKIVSSAILPTALDFIRAPNKVTATALKKIGLSMNQVDFILTTGYGRRSGSFGNKAVTEILSASTGASFLLSEVRTIIDIGGQDTKIIKLDTSGKVTRFVMNDRCAAGTGKFLEVITRALSLEISEIGDMAIVSESPCHVSSVCAVFAESEAITLRA